MPASARMVPSAYDAYFTAAATGAATLIGLLFVAVSLRDETIFGRNAIAGGEALALTAFGGLVNAFVVTLLGLVPNTNIGFAALVMAGIGILTIIRLHNRLLWGRNRIALVVVLGAYVAQIVYGAELLARPHDSGSLENLSYAVFVNLVVSLSRA